MTTKLIEDNAADLAPGSAIIPAKPLLAAITALQKSKAIEKYNTIPVLGFVRVVVEDGAAKVMGTNLDLWASIRVESDAIGELDIMLRPETLAHILKHGGTAVKITSYVKQMRDSEGAEVRHGKGKKAGRPVMEGRIQIECGNIRADINDLIPSEDWPLPALPTVEVQRTAEMPGAELLRAMRLVLPTVSTEETRYYLNGSLLEMYDGHLRMVTTDGHRLTRLDLPEIAWASSEKMILPRDTMNTLRHLILPGDKLHVSTRDTTMIYFDSEDGRISISAKLIDGTFPDYSRVIPELEDPAPFSVALSGDQIASVAHFQERSQPAKLSPADGTISVRCHGMGTTISVPMTGRGPDVGFNVQYLVGMCPRGEVITIESNNAGGPAIVRNEDPNLLRVLMPMRV